MKKFILSITAISLFWGIQAQSNKTSTPGKEVETLFKKDHSLGAYIGFIGNPTMIHNQEALFIGAETGLVFGHQLNIGIFGSGMVTSVKTGYQTVSGYDLYQEFGYGGFNLEPVLLSHKLIHITLPVHLGMGASVLSTRETILYNDYWVYNQDFYNPDLFFIAEPGVNLEVNLYKHLRLDMGISYRFANDVNLNSTLDNLNGLAGNIGLKLGWF